MAFAEALHACLLLGAIAVPVDLRLANAERERIVAGADLLISERLQSTVASKRLRDTVAREAPVSREHDLDAVAAIIHTSGTTSRPRPVELTYGNLLWSALGSAVALGFDARDRWLCTLPVSHVGGLSILVRSAIYATTAVIHERFQTEQVLEALRDREITLVSLVSTTLGRLLDAGLDSPPHLRCALTGGGPVAQQLLEHACTAGIAVSQTYGLTEACSQVSTVPVGAIDAGSSAGAGPALFCTRVRIAPDGEVLIAGPTVARTSGSVDGWLHSGDLGVLDHEGNLHIEGRKADTIVSGGENVAPAEVEAALEAHPEVLEAAVLGRADSEWGEAVGAIVVLRPGASVDVETLRAHCAERLASFKVPKQFTLSVERLPRTASGKLLRRELR
jgi:O-succinylbenzoic acid--CoA ligase